MRGQGKNAQMPIRTFPRRTKLPAGVFYHNFLMKKRKLTKEEIFWIALIVFVYITLEIAAYFATGHLVFPFCRYSCGDISWLD
jgi:hypothetical protein